MDQKKSNSTFQLGKEAELVITSMAPMGDGVGHFEGKQIFVPLTAPGDKVLVRIISSQGEASLIKILAKGSERQDPACEYFGICGGCSLQHLLTYNNFKKKLVDEIAVRLGCDSAIVNDAVKIGSRSRRRVEFKVAVPPADGSFDLGFFAQRTHKVITIGKCPATEDRIMSLAASLKNIKFDKPQMLKTIFVSLCDSGCDIIISSTNPKQRISAQDRQKLIDFAKDQDISRISEKYEDHGVNYNTFYNHGSTYVKFGDVEVNLPVGSFLQATIKGQEALTERVVLELQGYKRIGDLYCGCGTYSFPLSASAQIYAYESNDDMISSVYNAARKYSRNIYTEVRDLVKNPLSANELGNFDAVVINPPRAGAKQQIMQFSSMPVEKIVMISCNLQSFERDARCLIKFGYKLKSITPIDQFIWTHHLETVSVFIK